jgi:hypothetical protein
MKTDFATLYETLQVIVAVAGVSADFSFRLATTEGRPTIECLTPDGKVSKRVTPTSLGALDVSLFAAFRGNLTAEASTLEAYGWSMPTADITVRNPKTNGSRTYRYVETSRHDGDTRFWRYESAEGGTVTVFNT